MKYQILLEVDADLDILAVDANGNYVIGNDIVEEIANLSPYWPEEKCSFGGDLMPGTKVVDGRKIIHALITIESEDPLAELELLIVAYGLNWEVKSMYPVNDISIDEEDGIEKEVDSSLLEFLVEDLPLPRKLHQFAGMRGMEIK